MIKLFTAMLFILLPVLSLAHSGKESKNTFTYCVAPESSKKEMLFSNTYSGNVVSGYVKYGKKNKPIILKFVSETTVNNDELNLDISFHAQILTKFREIINGKATGEYIKDSQANQLYEITYKNYKTGKIITFLPDENSPYGCDWK